VKPHWQATDATVTVNGSGLSNIWWACTAAGAQIALPAGKTESHVVAMRSVADRSAGDTAGQLRRFVPPRTVA